MKIEFADVQIRCWESKHQKDEQDATRHPSLEHTYVSIVLRDGNAGRLERTVPCTLVVEASDDDETTQQAEHINLDQMITFQLMDGKQTVLSTHSMKLRESLPVLADGIVKWSDTVVLRNQERVDVGVEIHVKTDRKPRKVVSRAIDYKNRATKLANQLSLHKNSVVVGLLPPVIGCCIGIVATSPVWLPLTMFVGVLGFPVWLIMAMAGSLIITFSAISALLTVKVVQSKRVKTEVHNFLQGPHGQMLLFEGDGDGSSLSPSEISTRMKAYVLASPSRKLLASLIIDFVGGATLAVPLIGELADLAWAPISSRMIGAMYDISSPKAKYIAFLEEILPFTDIIPTATLAWAKENLHRDDIRGLLNKIRKHD